MFGSRVVPIFAAIGRNIDLLQKIEGINERVRRIVGSERKQPNGGIFELLVAAAYARVGAQVRFVPETKARRTHDMDVTIDGRVLAIECKRMEASEYGERERELMRNLWASANFTLTFLKRSTFGEVFFTKPINLVPENYLREKVYDWVRSKEDYLSWSDDFSTGNLKKIDLKELKKVLAKDNVLAVGTRILQLITGVYKRNQSFLQSALIKKAENPRYVEACDFAIVLNWSSLSEEAINAKARDILRKLSEANDQLPADTPSVIHIGIEAVDGDEVEKVRFDKIIETISKFDTKGKNLEYIYCHYLVPESPPDQAWAFDETMQWVGVNPKGGHPLDKAFLVLPEDEKTRSGTHWQSEVSLRQILGRNN
jgi:hypothetical protein